MKPNAHALAAALSVLVACALALPQPAPAQSLGDMLKSSVKRAVQSETERQVDKATRKVVRCAFGDEECIQAAKRSGATVEVQPPLASQPGTVTTSTPPASASTTRYLPGNIKPVPTGPAVPLAQMQANCDKEAVGRTAALRKDDPSRPGVPGSGPVLDKLKAVFADFAPNGYETHAGTHVMGRAHEMPAYMTTWTYSVLGYPYGCLSNGKFFKDGHYALSAYIFINGSLGDGPYRHASAYNPDSSNGDGTTEDAKFGFHTMWQEWMVDGLPQARNGYYHFAGDNQDIYWFTRDGRLPFAYVSREEFLRKQIAILQTELAHQRADYARIRANGIQYDQAKQDELFDFMYERPLARYRQWLNQPAAWLQQMAIVRGGTSASEGAGYFLVDPSQMDARTAVPIQPDPTYLDPSKPAGAPQYLVVKLDNQHKRGEYYQLRDLVERNVETFKSLVD